MATIRFRRGTAAAWTAANPILGVGEPGLETDTAKLKIGNGTDAWADLDYFTAGAGAAAATDTIAGIVELATPTEAVTGTDHDRAVTPEGLAAAITALGLTAALAAKQAAHANLSQVSGLSLVADRLPYANGTGTLSLATFTAAGRALIDDADASAQLTTLGVSTFINTLLDDADASTALSTLGITTFVKTLLDDTTAGGFLTTLGVSAFIQTLLDDADATTARATLGVPAAGTRATVATAPSGTLTPVTSGAFNYSAITAQAAALTVAAPSGSPADGDRLVIRIKDNGTARAITWNAVFEVEGVTLPTTTVVSKKLYVGCMWNANTSTWDVLAVRQQA